MNCSVGTFYFGVEIEEVFLSSYSHYGGKMCLRCLSVFPRKSTCSLSLVFHCICT